MRYCARIAKEDGSDTLGTMGVLTSREGQYGSLQAFVRYTVKRYGQSGTTYNLYRISPNYEWYPAGTLRTHYGACDRILIT